MMLSFLAIFIGIMTSTTSKQKLLQISCFFISHRWVGACELTLTGTGFAGRVTLHWCPDLHRDYQQYDMTIDMFTGLDPHQQVITTNIYFNSYTMMSTDASAQISTREAKVNYYKVSQS